MTRTRPAALVLIPLAALLVLAPVLLLLFLQATLGPGLPESLPTHWGPSGEADGFSDRDGVVTGTLVVASIATLAGLVGVALAPKRHLIGAWMAGIGASVAAVSASTFLMSALAAQSNGDTGWGFLAFSVALYYGALPLLALWLPLRPRVSAQDRAAEASPLWREDLTFTGILKVVLLIVTIPAVLMLSLALAFQNWVLLSALPILIGVIVLMLSFAKLEAVVTPASFGLRRQGSGRYLKRIPLRSISAVTAERLDPMQWGGWGYRVLPGRSAFISGSGPGLVVTYDGDKRFAVNLADPWGAESALRSELAKQDNTPA
ncbi:DUF1648 domain-containing protein [Haematomicrobium sanguinis]|uniref:DUF1648 domain-containing protein n=1 Tax=Haematomicrobium sanguinis TaxID=479106 RepID=UPI0012F7F048|nr:DUF1648 domain-containing protein [Haematomicrobium sanguinis]